MATLSGKQIAELVAEIPVLRKELARLNSLIEELEERLPDLDDQLELKPDIKQRLMDSLKRPERELLSSEEAWKRFKAR